MTTRKHNEKPTMDNRDPSSWQWLMDALPYLPLAIVTFLVGFVKVLHDGGAWPKALMSATLGTLITLPLYPVFIWIAESRDWPAEAAFAACTFVAFMGVEWIRNKADGLYEMLIGRWRKS